MTKKTIFITGCSSGIGLTAAHYAKNKLNFRVITSCRKQSDLAELKANGFEAILLDLDDSESIKQAAEQVISMTDNRLYALFNNAGYGVYGPLQEISRTELERQFSTNLFGLHELTMLLLPAMLPHKEGRIIQTSSVLGFISTAGRGAYAASKHAVEGWSDALRLELYDSGIKVSLIEPGPIKTAFTENVNQIDEQNKVVNPGIAARFALTTDDVMPALKQALTHQSPKARYQVTLVSHGMKLAKRFLPDWLVDAILRKK